MVVGRMDERELYQFAEQAREQRLTGVLYDETDFPLVGYCFENAFVLVNVLREAGFSNASVVVGTTDRVADELVQAGYELDLFSTVEELAGLSHYWVSVGSYFVDIAAESDDKLGEIIVSSSVPAGYYLYDDSFEKGDAVFTNSHRSRCVVCGSQKKACSHSVTE